MISAGDAFVDTQAFSRARARPLAPEQRRAAILDSVIPLLKEQGREVSTRQLAEAAGVAEGTLFRAFGDKESIVRAAVERYFDPGPFRDRLRGIDPDDPAEEKLRQLVGLMRERFEGVIGFVTALGLEQRPPAQPAEEGDWFEILHRMFRPEELAVPIDTLGFYVRLVAFGSAIPLFNQPHPFETEELVTLIARGVLPGKGAS